MIILLAIGFVVFLGYLSQDATNQIKELEDEIVKLKKENDILYWAYFNERYK